LDAALAARLAWLDEHYYRLRCKLVHERVTVGISDDQIRDFREVVESVLKKLYKLKFDDP
jgi:hypothetical protein